MLLNFGKSLKRITTLRFTSITVVSVTSRVGTINKIPAQLTNRLGGSLNLSLTAAMTPSTALSCVTSIFRAMWFLGSVGGVLCVKVAQFSEDHDLLTDSMNISDQKTKDEAVIFV